MRPTIKYPLSLITKTIKMLTYLFSAVIAKRWKMMFIIKRKRFIIASRAKIRLSKKRITIKA